MLIMFLWATSTASADIQSRMHMIHGCEVCLHASVSETRQVPQVCVGGFEVRRYHPRSRRHWHSHGLCTRINNDVKNTAKGDNWPCSITSSTRSNAFSWLMQIFYTSREFLRFWFLHLSYWTYCTYCTYCTCSGVGIDVPFVRSLVDVSKIRVRITWDWMSHWRGTLFGRGRLIHR